MKRGVLLVENLSVPTDRRVWQQALTLTRSGMRITVVCPRGIDRDTEPLVELEGISIYRYAPRFSTGGIAGYSREYSSALWHMNRILRRVSREGNIDVVHAANPPDVLLLAALAYRRHGTALIFDQHDLVPEFSVTRFGGRRMWKATRAAEQLSYRLADVVLVTNDSYRKVALDRGRRRPDDVFVVRNAPDLKRFRPVDPDPALKNGRAFLVGYVGLIGPEDGVDHSLHALSALRDRRTDWRAVFVGAGDALEGMKRLADELNLAEFVDFPGFMSGDQLISYLSTFDVCLAPNPRTPLNEISTMVKLLEYMAMAKPVVAYDLTETRWTAGDAVAYAKRDDPVSLADSIGELLDDSDRRSRMGRAGRARIEDELSWERSAEEMLKAYDRAMMVASRRSSAQPGSRPRF
jgi:glycosyltransferase involved in cell wall biosynthesis